MNRAKILSMLLLPGLLIAQPKEVIDAYNLSQAIVKKDGEKLKQLIQEGKDVNYQYNGRAALHTACDKGFTGMAALVIEAGADLDAYSEEGSGRTPLQFVTGDPMEDYSELTALLLTSGADPDRTLDPSQAPLFDAINHSHAASVELLLEHGASTEIKNSMNHSPLDYVNYLMDRGVTDAAVKAKLQNIKTLLLGKE